MTLDLTYDRPAWFVDAACRGCDPALFYPNRGESGVEAKRVCAGCAVRAECLDHAVVNRETRGIRGGLSEKQRRGMRRRTLVALAS